MVGDVKILGIGKFVYYCYIFVVKNENFVVYFDGELDVIILDLICVIDIEIGLFVINFYYYKG